MANPRIIRRSRHHWALPTSFAEGKHHSKNAPLSVDKSAFFVGAGRVQILQRQMKKQDRPIGLSYFLAEKERFESASPTTRVA